MQRTHDEKHDSVIECVCSFFKEQKRPSRKESADPKVRRHVLQGGMHKGADLSWSKATNLIQNLEIFQNNIHGLNFFAT